ncbi:Mitochondrial distribution and morphology protein 10 [Coemansia biformis]|uniref:Mitochondrial distribution and morphology protein 10 n=1 Tax=Coemansia biformis TaxID=1286918 RepID=A0A9W7Y5P4_9FUNG|nr:Mitochondrial distribution and morphology protein 10 [Coemansia biformis]
MVFTTSDYFPFLLRQFHRETGWDECNSYATFCRASKAILDFAVPYGLSVSTGRSVGSHLSSQLVFSMVPSTASSVGYLAASRPLFALRPRPATEPDAAALAAPPDPQPAPPTLSDILDSPATAALGSRPARQWWQQQAQDARDSQSLVQHIRAGMWRCNWGPAPCAGQPADARGPQTFAGEYLMVAQMYPSLASITGSYTVRRTAVSEVTVSGVSVAGAQPDVQLVAQHATNQHRWSSEATFGTSGRLFGLRGQYNFGDVAALDAAARAYHHGSRTDVRRVLGEKAHGRLSVGSEVYYGAQDSSGGMSVGVRYRYDVPLLLELTCVANPLMGHVSLAWTQQLRERVCAAARYDFNAFSLSSELAVGAEWQLDPNSLAKVRWSNSQGLRCLLDTRLSSMVLSVGLELRGGAGAGASPATQSGIGRLVRSFGLQFQWFL